MANGTKQGAVDGVFGWWGQTVTRLRWWVIVVWVIVAACGGIAYVGMSGDLSGPDYGVPGSDSATVRQSLIESFPALGTEQDVIVFHSESSITDDGVFRDAVGATLAEVLGHQGVSGVLGPFDLGAQKQVSADKRSAFAALSLDGSPRENAATARDIQAIVDRSAPPEVSVAVTGSSPLTNDLVKVEKADALRAESLGVPVALVVLVLALGALCAGLVPLAVAGVGLLAAFGLIAATSGGSSVDALLLAVVTMIGTGIGIDYSLFIVSRFREELAGNDVSDRKDLEGIAASMSTTLRTTGRTIAASGLIVVIAMSSLLLVNSPVFRQMALGVSAAVIAVLITALTLLPALLAALGPALDRGHLPRLLRGFEMSSESAGSTWWSRWVRVVMRRPVLFGTGGVLVLVLLAWPVTSMQYGINMGTGALGAAPSGQAAEILQRDFSPGLVAPILVVDTDAGQSASSEVAQLMKDDPRILEVLPSQRSGGRELTITIPAVPVDSTDAFDLVRDLRDATGQFVTPAGDPRVVIGGTTAEFVDLSDEATGKFPMVVGLVLLLSVVFLGVVLRSIVIPLKAVAMNLLATGAAIGVTVAVFQWGWGSDVLGFAEVGFLQVYLPITVFVILFGLSMDYEVFLIGRMKEAWDSSGEIEPPSLRNTEAVADGVQHTARPITAAAAIMVVVFGSFVTAHVLELQQFGVALAVAIALDAIVVRMILVPAFMKLLGRWNWWPDGTKAESAHDVEGAPV
ncbi:MMPL family transporter [Rhodococcus sp. W8901]|uniref:MMPL family transporter n=1 Tax=Rhodococcus sp. W8901 TaxID=2742603 RepID=UPI001582B5F7|nr:efflux RND transporter permease subunit [Rhodococcus sp. W8901]QKT11582.1 MMPL family transporter [Rhodococcus sp. W8901]